MVHSLKSFQSDLKMNNKTMIQWCELTQKERDKIIEDGIKKKNGNNINTK